MIDRKLVTFIGCAMINFITGTIYCTGSIMPYVASYIGVETGYVSMKSLTIVFYICLLTYSMSIQLASMIQARFTPKKSIYLGTFLYIIVVFVTSALTNHIAVIIIYGVLLGMGSGLAYLPALMIGINCYPNRKGLATGIMIGCFAIGSCVFNFISLAIVNPDNEKASVVKEINGVKEKFFSEDIARNVPKMFWILGSIYSAVIFTALAMVKDIEKTPEKKFEKIPPHAIDENHLQVKGDNHDESSREHSEASSRMHSEEEDKKADNPQKPKEPEGANPDLHLTVAESFRTRQLYQVFFATMFSGTAGMFAIASFKTIGIQYGYDDNFLTITGSIGSVMNGTNRPFWGYLSDRKHYRFTYMIICLVQMAICFTFPLVNMYQPAFLIWLCILYSCSGGTFTLLPSLALRMYGKEIGSNIYSCFVFGMGCAAIFVYIIQMYVVVYTGQNSFFYILGGLSTCSLISNIFFREKINWKA